MKQVHAVLGHNNVCITLLRHYHLKQQQYHPITLFHSVIH